MQELGTLINRIIDRVNINLREPAFDVGPHIRDIIPMEKLLRFYAFYALTPHHPLHFHFTHSSLAGSYFLGKCVVDHSVLYKSDIRGDELKSEGDVFRYGGLDIPLHNDEVIHIKDSFLVKTLVHSFSHDPEHPEELLIQNTVSMHQANIHGSAVEGSFLAPFSTVDLTSIHDCVIGAYSYIQAGELSHEIVDPGTIWVRVPHVFDCTYRFPAEVLSRYVQYRPGSVPEGILMGFLETREKDFEGVFSSMGGIHSQGDIPAGSSVSRYALVRGNSTIGDNVVVAQRAYLEDAWLGKGANAQENCYIIHSRLEGFDVTAHGAKILHAHLGKKVFVGFNSFLNGSAGCPLRVGDHCIIMPHTIIDPVEPLEFPAGSLVWGFIRNRGDVNYNAISFEDLKRVDGSIEHGALRFNGSGAMLLERFQNRIENILEANGAYFDGTRSPGHAQKSRDISFSTIQPYSGGGRTGIYPTIDIRP